jgi:parallel beta-helix repeat protein
MNEQQAFERIVAESVSSIGSLVPSDDAIDRTLSRTSVKRQRPRWLAFIKEPPMHSESRTTVGSPTVRVATVLAATFMLILAMTIVGAGAQRLLASGDIVVSPDGSGDHTTIAEAVAAATDGDTILVQPGTYDESVVIDKDIALRGDGDRDTIVLENSEEMPRFATLTQSDLPFALRLDDSDATIENLTLRGESSRVEVNGGAPTFSNVHFDDIGRVFGLDQGSNSVPAGVHVQDGANGALTDSLFSRATLVVGSGSSPHVSGNTFSPGAIFTDGEGTDPLVEDNAVTAEGTFHAITAFGAASPEIRDNTVTGEASGIYIQYGGFPSSSTAGWPTITGNTIEGTRAGIELTDGAGGDIEANQLTDNEIGISVSGSNGEGPVADIIGNTVRGGGTGIRISGAISPQVTGNDIAGAATAGIVTTYLSSPTLTDNVICDNAVNVMTLTDSEPQIDESNEICEDAASG